MYPSVDTSWLGGGRNTLAAFHAQSAAAMAVGADGIYYFNMFYAPAYIPEMRRELKDLRFVPKLYYGYYQRLSQFSANMNKFDQLADLRGDGLVVYPGGKAASMLITVGDDFSDPEVAAMRPRVVLDVNTLNDDDEVPLQAKINGSDAGKPVFNGGNYTFRVDPSLVKAGENRFEFSLDP